MIDADELLRTICGKKCGCEPEECGYEKRCSEGWYVENAPTVDVETPEYSMKEFQDALQDVAKMDPTEQKHYFNTQIDLKSSMEGLYCIVLSLTPEDIIRTVEKYRDEKYKAQMQAQRMKVKRLAEEIGMYNLKKFVNELKDGGT